nr:hypothetical protein [Tanacetum cinerariifolium]
MKCLGIVKLEVVVEGIRSQMGQVGGAGGGAEVVGKGVQVWRRSRFLRYIDTRPNGDALRKCILSGPYKPTTVLVQAVAATDDSLAILEHTTQEMHADLKYAESLEKEIDELEYDKAEFSNMYDMILQESVSSDVTCSYLLSFSDLDAQAELQCLYLHKVKECDCLAQKLSKQT